MYLCNFQKLEDSHSAAAEFMSELGVTVTKLNAQSRLQIPSEVSPS